MTHGKLSEETVKRLAVPEIGNHVTYFAGAMIQGAKAPRGFGVRVTAAGARAFVLNYRLRGREHRFTVGAWPDWSALKAVQEARRLRQRIDRGENPIEDRTPSPATETVASVLDAFVAQHARNKNQPLRSADEYESAFERLVKPRIGKLGIYDVRRSHVIKMLDEIENTNGPVMADRTLAYVRKAFNWYAVRDDLFSAPVVRGMGRIKPKDRARTRVLSDEEIRAIWPVVGQLGTFGAFVRMLLLTAQRHGEVARMSHKEIGGDGIWIIPAERYKTKRPNFVPLSTSALAVIEAQPRFDDCDYVFPSRAKTPFSRSGKSKAKLDKAVLAAMKTQAKKGAKVEPIPNWTLHDLRRTAKTLMARAGVRPDISERVLGHVIAGVEGTYDRHSYADEKRDALEKLAAMIERILNPLPSSVASITEHRIRT
ncbi:MAG: site-specific integrase [Xanthobacteraceae bacterium]|jgi:integrase